jgi:thiol reductant ABC exporter CydD subunit
VRPLDPRLLRHARAARRHIALCVVLGAATAGLVLVQAQLLATGIARVVDRSVGAGAVAGILLGLGAVVAGRALVAGTTEAVSQRSAAAVKSELRRQLVAHAAELGPVAQAGTGRAEVATLAVDGLDDLDGYFSRYLPQLVLAVIVPTVVIARLFVADPTSAVIVVLTVPLIPVFMALIGMATEAATARRWDALVRLSHHFLDVVSGLPTLKVFGRARAQADSVRRITDEYRTTTMATLRIAFLSSFVLELLATLSVALVAVGVGLRMVDGELALATGLLVIILAPEAYLPIREVGVQFHAAADGVAASNRVFALLEVPSAASGARTDVPDLRAGGQLEIRDASVTHPGRDGAAPHAASLRVGPGELVALAGESGVGKTSLLSAVLGAAPLATGAITVSGGGTEVDLTELDRTAWRATLAWVDQSPFVFAGTVADNVRLADPAATDQVVRQALDTVGLGAMELDRPVGESGRGLSAGERRRVALARAVLRDAPLVLLDEPTAGLDHEAEAVVLAAIRRLAERSAVLMAAHRPEAIAVADRVVAVEATAAPTAALVEGDG